jgi:SpoVK/Ycf46/Vps4 family AAA+-type ATPase
VLIRNPLNIILVKWLGVLREVESWLDARDWYGNRQINWRKSILLTGKPGTGKSQLILEVAKKLKLRIYIFDLSEMNNEELGGELNTVLPGSIILFEDIDSIWEGRQNKFADSDSGGISFDYFINKLSGVNSIKNCFVFATTNHMEKLDEALIRPGRFDEVIEIPVLTMDAKAFITEKMLDLWPDMIYSVVTENEETAAEFEQKCTALALELYWRDK